MGKRSVIPFGPQHPVLPEPIHLDLVIEDERVIEAVPTIGYIHRGLEKLAETKDFNEYVYVAERICGICSFMHGMGYCMALEEIMHVELPARAEYLRVIWAELSRIHSHLLWMGLTADAFGFESLFMQCWRLREKILDIFEMTTGGRVIFSVCKIGGLRKDIDADTLKLITKTLEDVGREFKTLETTFLKDQSVIHRLRGIGVLSAEEALTLGAVGPMLRASGVAQDIRKTGYAAYRDLDFDIITSNDGDSYARCAVRMKEVYESISLIRQAAGKIPEGEISVKVTGSPNGQSFIRLEQPRGEVLYHARANGTKFLERFRVRTPTFANLPALLKILEGRSLANVPVMILTIDPCISCTER
jgi:ech hydrogenase subunit E